MIKSKRAKRTARACFSWSNKRRPRNLFEASPSTSLQVGHSKNPNAIIRKCGYEIELVRLPGDDSDSRTPTCFLLLDLYSGTTFGVNTLRALIFNTCTCFLIAACFAAFVQVRPLLEANAERSALADQGGCTCMSASSGYGRFHSEWLIIFDTLSTSCRVCRVNVHMNSKFCRLTPTVKRP